MKIYSTTDHCGLCQKSMKNHRLDNVDKALKFGNHKGATQNQLLMKYMIEEDVIHGFILLLPLNKIKRIPGILLTPLHIIRQNTINKDEVITKKDRLAHDQSFAFHGSNTSVNSHLNKSKLVPCTFGWVIKRLINLIVAAQRKHPNCQILASKVDFKSAYRQCHLNHTTAI